MFSKLIGVDGDVTIQVGYICGTHPDCWNAPFNYDATYSVFPDGSYSFYRCGC